jgi:hypothetical protein
MKHSRRGHRGKVRLCRAKPSRWPRIYHDYNLKSAAEPLAFDLKPHRESVPISYLPCPADVGQDRHTINYLSRLVGAKQKEMFAWALRSQSF